MVTLVGDKVQLLLVEFVVTESAMLPLNPLTAEIATVDVPAAPASVVTLVGLAVKVKSWTVKVTVAV